MFVLCLTLCGVATAQTGFDAGGGSARSAAGSVSVSFGQAICLYPDDGRYVDVQGVQQPYECTKTYVGDTVRDVEECDSYHFKTKTFTTSGLHFDTVYGAVEGICDSIYPIYLTINHSTGKDSDAVEVDQFTWRGMTYYYSGIYFHSTPNPLGCYNIDTLNLTIKDGSGEIVRSPALIDFVTGGESSRVSVGSVSLSFGQTFCLYPIDENYYDGQGVQQPYRISIYDTVRAAVCQNSEYIDDEFNIASTYTSSEGVFVFSHRYLTYDGLDSVITLVLTVATNAYDMSATGDVCGTLSWRGRTITESGSGRDTVFNAVEGVCDSIYILNVTVYHNDTADTLRNIEACDQYHYRNKTFTTSGLQNDTLYGAVHGICDSIFPIQLTIKHSSGKDTVAEENNSFVWRGTTYYQTGTYYDISVNSQGCDSIDTLSIVVNHPNCETQYTNISEDACDSYTWHGTTYTTSTTVRFDTFDASYCDSIVTLTLTIKRSGTVDTFASVGNDVLTWRGKTYEYTGIYRDTLPVHAVNGCDSILVLYLVANHYVCEATYGDIYTSACDSYVWPSNGRTYFVSTNLRDTLRNAAGCDSVRTLHLTINYGNGANVNATACDRYSWHGTTYTESTNTATYTTQNSLGCDSVTTLRLTIKNSVVRDTFATVSTSLTWHGSRYDANGIYRDTLATPAANGCDSIVALHLHIGEGGGGGGCEGIGTRLAKDTCDNYTWHAAMYVASGTYLYYYSNNEGCLTIDTLLHYVGQLLRHVA